MSRAASHAGSWYSDNSRTLDEQLNTWLSNAQAPKDLVLPLSNCRAILGPHAGYRYSGQTAAFAYKCIDPTRIRRVFILGPSHHVHIPGCALSKCAKYVMPLGDLTLDRQVISDLKATRKFTEMSLDVDEDEHSIEMHLPYVYKTFERAKNKITIVPILVGSISRDMQAMYGSLLAPYLSDPENFFVISSDFCHWGSRFTYTYYRPAKDAPAAPLSSTKEQPIPIHESIELVDREGMEIIESLDHAKFVAYLAKTKNTICGCKPIGILLGALEELRKNQSADAAESESDESKPRKRQQKGTQVLRFIHYAQSSKVKTPGESSVSYAAAYVTIP